MRNRKVFFPGLNSLRGIAAIAVVIPHIFQFSRFYGMPNAPSNPILGNIASQAVTFFFVLSEFLITYLLLTEKEKCRQIDIKRFYVRRILRIWPVYYLVIGLAFGLAPIFKIFPTSEHLYNPVAFSLYLFILPNVAYAFNMAYTIITPTWSIGVEEQFYLIWPLIVKYTKDLGRVLISIVLIYLAIKLFILVLAKYYNPVVLRQIGILVDLTRIDCMAIGGLGAFCLFCLPTMLQPIYNKIVEISIYVTLLSFLIVGVRFYYLTNEMYAIVFLILILNICGNTNPLLTFEIKLLQWLGKISYGIYMYHMFAIIIIGAISKALINQFIFMNLTIYWIMICFFTILFTLLIANFSYKFFELYFLEFKAKYSPGISRNDLILSKEQPELNSK